jgi:UDP:flavonoid glycosyltransferase YjiC (YdhE family)
MAKILIHTLGSSGDFNPTVALALEMRRRGHDVRFVVQPSFAQAARALGFTTTEGGPAPDRDPALMQRLLAPARNGLTLVDVLFREILIPAIRPAADLLTPFVQECDLFVCHTVQLAARVVARRTGVPWVSISPAALVYPTGDYPPPGIAWKGCPHALSRLGWGIGQRFVRHLDGLANAEYAALGLPPIREVVTGGAYSRLLTLGLWSPSYFPRPADWPDWLQVGGYGRWDAPAPPDAPPVTLPSGDGPLIVFTLGSTVVSDPQGFYEMAVRAVAPTPWRALLVGAPDGLPIPEPLRRRVRTARYAPYGEVFAQADAVVHSGGVGTTQACCWAGKPAVVVPRGADQFENAAHLQREEWGLRLKPEHLSATLMRLRLERMLDDARINRRVADLGAAMRAEPGPSRSADLLEAVL